MFDWIAQNHQVLSTIASLAMLVVWIAYLQVFVSSYRRQIRANILINMGAGSGLAARCLVSNMSAGPIYVHSMILDLHGPDRTLTCPVTETEGLEDWKNPTDLNLWTRQGPLDPGEVRDMGSFDTMLDHALRSTTGDGEPDPWLLRDAVERLTVRIIAVYGSENLPIAAERGFAIHRTERGAELLPSTVQARQLRSRRQRRAIGRLLEAELRRPEP